MYRPDYFGTVPDAYVWTAFNGVAQRLSLDEAAQEKLLGAKPEPNNAPPPAPAIATRIQLAKDCLLHTDLIFRDDMARSEEFFHRPMPAFNGHSPLQVMGMTPPEILVAVPKGTGMPHVDGLWQRGAPYEPDMGLLAVRAFVARASGVPYVIDREQAIRRTMRLIAQGKQPL